MKVEALMTRHVRCCTPQQSLADAAKVMWELDCGCVPVCDGSGSVAGMITDRDICMSAYFRGLPLAAIRIEEAMPARPVTAVRPDDTIDSAVAVMREAQVRRLPVVDRGGRIVGILSLHDIAIAAERQQRSKDAHALDLRQVALTLSAVSHPRPTA